MFFSCLSESTVSHHPFLRFFGFFLVFALSILGMASFFSAVIVFQFGLDIASIGD